MFFIITKKKELKSGSGLKAYNYCALQQTVL